jgi:hypothetical protein
MEPEGSLPRSQEPVTGPYPEPDQSISCYSILFLYEQFYYPPNFFLIISFLVVFPPEPCSMHFNRHAYYIPYLSHPP